MHLTLPCSAALPRSMFHFLSPFYFFSILFSSSIFFTPFSRGEPSSVHLFSSSNCALPELDEIVVAHRKRSVRPYEYASANLQPDALDAVAYGTEPGLSSLDFFKCEPGYGVTITL